MTLFSKDDTAILKLVHSLRGKRLINWFIIQNLIACLFQVFAVVKKVSTEDGIAFWMIQHGLTPGCVLIFGKGLVFVGKVVGIKGREYRNSRFIQLINYIDDITLTFRLAYVLSLCATLY